MNTLAEILKRHIWCVMTIAAIILLALITLSFGKDVNLVSHLSLTSAIVSIILAVIVIVYMYFQDQRSSQNTIEMRRLIDEGYRTMTDKADVMVTRTQSLEQMIIAGITQPRDDSDITSTPLVLQKGATLDISIYSDMGLITLYTLKKSFESRKSISMHEVFFKSAVKNYDAMAMFSLGIIISLRVFFGKDFVSISPGQQELKKLPDGFKESVTETIDKRLKKYKEKGKDEHYDELKDTLDSIDNYFNNF